MIRILVADDHAIVRQGLRQILSGRDDMGVTGEASSGDETLERVREQQWDVLVLDLSFPDRSGLDVLKQIRAQYPALPILVLSMHPEEQYGVRVLRAGASGYLSKESVPDLLVEAIRKVASGNRFLSPTLSEKIAIDFLSGPSERPHEKLSDREFEVFERIVAGRSVTEIAEELNVSVKTVSTHRTRLLEKMGMKNNAGLIRYAIQQGLLS